jgi:predicted peroxiredoxin
MAGKLIFNCTHDKEDPERATLPFVAANIAAIAGEESIVLCTIEAVWVGTEGGTDGIAQPGLPVSPTYTASSSTTAARCGCAEPAPSRAGSRRSSSRRAPRSSAQRRSSKR